VSLQELTKTAHQSGARVDVLVEKGSQQGSAVLLRVRTEDLPTGKGPVGYFATCYHVLYNAENCSLLAGQEANGLAKVGDSDGLRFFTDPKRDIVIIRAPMPAAQHYVPIFANDEDEHLRTIGTGDEVEAEGAAFGFPFYQSKSIYPSKVRMGGPQDAASIFNKKVLRLGYMVRPIFDEATAPGMSGGPVLDGQRRFVGLIVARLPDVVGFVIPAEYAVADLDEAMKRGGKLSDFNHAHFKLWDGGPYDENWMVALHASAPTLNNYAKWDLAGEWEDLFSGKNFDLRERFQEIRVDLEALTEVAGEKQIKGISLDISPASFSDGRGQVEVVVNGNQKDKTIFDPGKPITPCCLDKDLVDGENLIVIRRRTSAHVGATTQPFRLNSVAQAVPLQFAVSIGGQPAYTVRRELPAVIDSFSVYLTLIKPAPAGQNAGARYNAVIAISLNRLAEVVNRFPVSYKGPFRDALGLTSMDVDLEPRRPFLTFEIVSPKALRMTGEGIVTLSEIRAHYAGLTLTKTNSVKPNVTADAILQLLGSTDGRPRAACRFVGGKVAGFDVPVGSDFKLDIGGIACEFLLSKLNDRFDRTAVDPERSTPLDPKMIRTILDLARPGLIPPDVSVDLVDVNLAAAPDGQPWALATLRVSKLGVGPAAGPLHGVDRVPAAPSVVDDEKAMAIVDLLDVPKDAMASILKEANHNQNQATASGAAAGLTHGHFRVDMTLASPGETTELHPGHLDEWVQKMKGHLAEALSISGTFDVPVDSLGQAVGESIDKYRIINAGGEGRLDAVVADGRTNLSIKEPATFTAKSLARNDGSFVADDPIIKAETLHVALPVGRGEDATFVASVTGSLSIPKLTVSGATAENVSASFRLHVDEADPKVVHLKLVEISGKLHRNIGGLELNGNISHANVQLDFKNGVMTGMADLGPLKIEFKEDGVHVPDL
jgi:hypothetical protein